MSLLNQTIDGARLLADLHRLRQFGTYKTGVHRPTYSDDRHAVARNGSRGGMREAGLAPEIDGIGNVIGRGDGDGPRVLLGSHTETQNHAGWLDGALGVMYGLEVARTLGRGVDVAAWADEEGHYGNFLGSRSYVGEIAGCRDRHGYKNKYHGKPLRDALAGAGLAGKPRARVEPGRYRGYLEAHIEQGDELEVGRPAHRRRHQHRRHLAVSASRSRACRTTPARRAWRSARMPASALVRLATRDRAALPRASRGPRSVWTVGRITLDPGAPSIVPGGAEMWFQFRDADPQVLDAPGSARSRDRRGPERRRSLPRDAAHHLSVRAEGDGRGVPGGARPCGRTQRPRPVAADAERRRATTRRCSRA